VRRSLESAVTDGSRRRHRYGRCGAGASRSTALPRTGAEGRRRRAPAATERAARRSVRFVARGRDRFALGRRDRTGRASPFPGGPPGSPAVFPTCPNSADGGRSNPIWPTKAPLARAKIPCKSGTHNPSDAGSSPARPIRWLSRILTFGAVYRLVFHVRLPYGAGDVSRGCKRGPAERPPAGQGPKARRAWYAL
jgi:hypothetical protein